MARGLCDHGVPWDDDVDDGVPRCERCMAPVPYVDVLRAERDALRARVAQLEAALRLHMLAIAFDGECYCLGRWGILTDPDFWDAPHDEACQAARAALAATPADAGRRWEAMREVCEAATEWVKAGGPRDARGLGGAVRALARLDAEGKPK